MIRRAALAACLLFTISTTSVSAGEPPVVDMLSDSFSPSVVLIPVGEGVVWDNGSGLSHTTTANKFNFWDRSVTTASETQVTMTRSGTWAYHCEIHSGMTGKIKVRPIAFPSSGTTATTFQIQVASASLPAGFVEDVQRRKGSNPFKKWRYGINTQSTSWTPGSAGTWQFRARYRKTSNGSATGWSQPLTIIVS